MAYYHDLVTQQSWEELTQLTKLVPCVLIGGWAVYLYTKRLKSKDIDILVDFDALRLLKDQYAMTRNDRLKKYQATRDIVEVDIYLPHYSKIGIPVEDLMGRTRGLEGFTVIDPNYLAALKLYALGERGRTPKGRKDFLDILSLFLARVVDSGRLKEVVEAYHLDQAVDRFREFLSESRFLPELDLTAYSYARLKRAITEQFVPG
ncbi:MAG TPA: hypothetical protein DIS62_03205 [Candidatus Kerfeldbacteria bacterium]|nr:hypothetical protein [Candidatus Kerfeldbacteria bacterium]